MESHENSIWFMYSALNIGSSLLTDPTHVSYLDPALHSAFRGLGQWGMRTQRQSCYNWISAEQKHKLSYCGVGAVRRLICGCVHRFTLAHRHFLGPHNSIGSKHSVYVCSCHKSLQHAEKHNTICLSSAHTQVCVRGDRIKKRKRKKKVNMTSNWPALNT